MRKLHQILRDERGAALIEATIVMPLVLILTFGLLEFGNAMWRYHTAEKATAAGVRWLATRHGVAGAGAPVTNELYTAQVPDCFVNTSAAPGAACAQVAGATGWSQTCSGAGGGACSSTQMAGLLTEMRRYAPFINAANVTVELRGSALGFVGRGRAVPLITVRTTGLTFDFVTLDGLLGLGPITMPSFASTLVAEDQKEGPGI
jgi:Flp pilus assembly protein TadG